MKNNQAFTLIELLVVVLIIGILAAVALPQYKVAVAKARMTQLVTLANSVVQAQERYYLANGQYATNWDELDIDLPGSTTSASTLTNEAGWRFVFSRHEGGAVNSVHGFDSRLPGVMLLFAYNDAGMTGWNGRRACYANRDNNLANIVCKNATGKSTRTGEGDSGVGQASSVYHF